MSETSTVVSPEPSTAPPSRRWKRRHSLLVAATAAVLALVGGTYLYVASVPVPDFPEYGESSTFMYTDGESEMAGYGEAYRRHIDEYEDLPSPVIDAVIGVEDPDYFAPSEPMIGGMLRGLFGGDESAGITERLARQLAGDETSSPAITLTANELEKQYSKDEILLEYLNLSYYGRGAYGFAAASEVWFDKPFTDLTLDEAVLIALQIESPAGEHDPSAEADLDVLRDQWLEGMALITDGSHHEPRAAADFPAISEFTEARGTWGGDTPTGFITNPFDGYVWDELLDRYGLDQHDLYGETEGSGGYTIVTTVDKELQDLAVETAGRGALKRATDTGGNHLDEDGNVVDDRADAALYVNEDGYYEFENTNSESALYDQHPSMAGSLVAIDPDTGEVAAYFGGDDGLGIDKAGYENPHAPSSTFKMITAATVMTEANASISSWFDGGSPREFESLGGDAIINSATHDSDNDVDLATALRESLNTPMYAIAEDYGATNVLATAVRMGVAQMDFIEDDQEVTYRFRIEDDGAISYSRYGVVERADGTYVTDENGHIDQDAAMTTTYREIAPTSSGEPEWAPLDISNPRAPADYHIGFGQYATPVIDMAAVYATIANDGEHVETHFVKEVYRDGEPVEPIRDPARTQAISVEIARDLQWVGSEIAGDAAGLDRDITGAIGTWEAGADYSEYGANAHAWFNGAVPQLSVATWVGNAFSDSAPLLNPQGGVDDTYGAILSGPVWTQFMEAAIEAKGWEAEPWAGKTETGTMLVDDIVNPDGTIDSDSAFCDQYPDDDRC